MLDTELRQPPGFRPDPERAGALVAPELVGHAHVPLDGAQTGAGAEGTTLRSHLQQTIVLLKDLADQTPRDYLLMNGAYARYVDGVTTNAEIVKGWIANTVVAILPTRSDWLVEKVSNVTLVPRQAVLEQRAADTLDLKALVEKYHPVEHDHLHQDDERDALGGVLGGQYL